MSRNALLNVVLTHHFDSNSREGIDDVFTTLQKKATAKGRRVHSPVFGVERDEDQQLNRRIPIKGGKFLMGTIHLIPIAKSAERSLDGFHRPK